MKDETTVTRARGAAAAAPPRGETRARSYASRGSRRGAALGVPEIVALAASALLLLAAIGSYLFLLRSQSARAQALEAERAQLEKQLQALRGSVTQGKDTQTSVRDILDSLQRFEIEHLGQGIGGSTSAIRELHRLMLKNKLRISGGMSYTQLEETPPGAEKRPQQTREAGAGRIVQSVFPGIGITMTVEGSYPNLRRFIREVEGSQQFVVINAVELEGVTDAGAAAGGATAGPNASGARGTLVSLRLDMAAYFRRAGARADSAPTRRGMEDGAAR